MFYTILNKATGNHKTFAFTQDTYKPEQHLISIVKRRPSNDGKCSCDFVGVPDCGVHFYKPFAHLVNNDVKLFNKLLSDANEPWNVYVNLTRIIVANLERLDKEGIIEWQNEKDLHLVIYRARNCGRCGEWLTNPQSIERGIGPVCEQNSLG